MNLLPKKFANFSFTNLVWQNDGPQRSAAEEVGDLMELNAEEVKKLSQKLRGNLEDEVLDPKTERELLECRKAALEYATQVHSGDVTEEHLEKAIRLSIEGFVEKAELTGALAKADRKELLTALSEYMFLDWDAFTKLHENNDLNKKIGTNEIKLDEHQTRDELQAVDEQLAALHTTEEPPVEGADALNKTENPTTDEKLNTGEGPGVTSEADIVARIDTYIPEGFGKNLNQTAHELITKNTGEKWDEILASATDDAQKANVKKNYEAFETQYGPALEMAKKIAAKELDLTEENFSEEKIKQYITSLAAASAGIDVLFSDENKERIKTEDLSNDKTVFPKELKDFDRMYRILSAKRNRSAEQLEGILQYVPDLREKVKEAANTNTGSATGFIIGHYQTVIREAMDKWARDNKKSENKELTPYPPVLETFFAGIDGGEIRAELEKLVLDENTDKYTPFYDTIGGIDEKISEFFDQKNADLTKLIDPSEGPYKELKPLENQEDAQLIHEAVLEAKAAGAGKDMRDQYRAYLMKNAVLPFADWLKMQKDAGKINKWQEVGMRFNRFIENVKGLLVMFAGFFGKGDAVDGWLAKTGLSDEEKEISDMADDGKRADTPETPDEAATRIAEEWENSPTKVDELQELNEKYGDFLDPGVLDLTINEAGAITGSLSEVSHITEIKNQLEKGNVPKFFEWANAVPEDKREIGVIDEGMLQRLDGVLNNSEVKILSADGNNGLQLEVTNEDADPATIKIPEEGLKEFNVGKIETLLNKADDQLGFEVEVTENLEGDWTTEEVKAAAMENERNGGNAWSSYFAGAKVAADKGAGWLSRQWAGTKAAWHSLWNNPDDEE